MATCINSSRSCLPPFYTIPIFPLFISKDFSFTCIISIVQAYRGFFNFCAGSGAGVLYTKYSECIGMKTNIRTCTFALPLSFLGSLPEDGREQVYTDNVYR